MCIVSTFMLWGPFNSKFIHCADYVILLQLPHIFGTCLDWCSGFSCILRVKSHFINTRFYVCSFYIPYAKSVWSDCQHTSQIWVTACFPLVHCLFWKASREELFGSLSQAASCCACEWCICRATCAAWMKKGMGFEMHLLLHVNAGLVSEPGATNATPEWLTKVSSHPGRCMVLGERNSSELRSLQSRNALPTQALTQKIVFSFSETEMLPSHWYRDRQSSKIWQISAATCWHNGRSLAKKHLTNFSLYINQSINQSISYFLSTVLLTVMYCTNLTTEMA